MAAVIILDQVSKFLVRVNIPKGEWITVGEKLWGEFLQIGHLENTGAAFSLSLPNPMWNRAFFIGTSVLAVIFIIWLLSRATHKIQVTAFGLVLGGAIGNNLIDRPIFGAVTDFLNFDIPDLIKGMERFPVFNIADSAIFIGMCLLIIDVIFISGKKAPSAEPLTTPEINLPDKEL